jgi:GH15 family glucan-1,4-alpha-glucosidase
VRLEDMLRSSVACSASVRAGGAADGAFEGAFLSCCFWLAVAQAREGRADAAEATLARAEAAAGELGLFAEEIDARDGSFRGNVPLAAQARYRCRDL